HPFITGAQSTCLVQHLLGVRSPDVHDHTASSSPSCRTGARHAGREPVIIGNDHGDKSPFDRQPHGDDAMPSGAARDIGAPTPRRRVLSTRCRPPAPPSRSFSTARRARRPAATSPAGSRSTVPPSPPPTAPPPVPHGCAPTSPR